LGKISALIGSYYSAVLQHSVSTVQIKQPQPEVQPSTIMLQCFKKIITKIMYVLHIKLNMVAINQVSGNKQTSSQAGTVHLVVTVTHVFFESQHQR